MAKKALRSFKKPAAYKSFFLLRIQTTYLDVNMLGARKKKALLAKGRSRLDIDSLVKSYFLKFNQIGSHKYQHS